MGLRAEIEEDLAETLEDPDDFGMPVILINPDGGVQSISANDATSALYGQILYDSLGQDENDIQTIDHAPVVSLRITSLDRVPQSGEEWSVRIPISPVVGAPIVTFLLDKAFLYGGSIGYIRLTLRKTEQS